MVHTPHITSQVSRFTFYESMYIAKTQPNKLWAQLTSMVRNSLPFRYPDLGLICFGAFVMLIGVGAIVPIRSIYARQHGATMAELGFMASAWLLGGLLFQYPSGWASDKWGRKPLLVASIAISGLITFLFLLYDYPWYFIALRFVEGASGAAIGPAANAYVIDAVPAKDRGAAFGWLGSAFSAGFMLGPAIGGFMVDGLGYAAPFIFGGVTSLLTALFIWRKMGNSRPGQEALARDEDASPEEAARVKRQIPKKLFVPALAGALVITMAAGAGDGLFISIWTIWLNDLHASTSFIGLTFVTFSLPLMLLMPTTGKMADKYRLTPLIALPGIVISFVYLFYGFTSNLWLIAAMGVFEGTLVAIMGPALSAYIANLSPENARGRLQGVISTSRTVAGLASSMLVALLYGVGGALYPFLMLAAVQIVISVAGGLLIWRVERRTALLTSDSQAVGLQAATAAPLLEDAAK